MSAPTVEELREALSEHGRDNYEHGYWERAGEIRQATGHEKEAGENFRKLWSALDELATLRASHTALVEALKAGMAEHSLTYDPCACLMCRKGRAALTPKATTTKETK